MKREAMYLIMAMAVIAWVAPTAHAALFVEDFEGFEAGTAMNDIEGWDIRGQTFVVAIDPADSGNQVLEVTGNNQTRGYMDIPAIAVDDDDTVVTFRVLYPSDAGGQNVSVGVGGTNGSDWNDFAAQIIVAGGNLSYRSAGSTIVIESVVLDRWYTISLALKQTTETYDIYIDGELKIEGANYRLSHGEIQYFYIKGGNPASTRYIDDIRFGFDPGYAASNPTPANGNMFVDPATLTELSWEGPVPMDGQGGGDPNVVSVAYDLVYYSKLTADVTEDDPNLLEFGTTVLGVTSPYDISSLNISYEESFFWRVDTTVTFDANDIVGDDYTALFTGANWMFATAPEFFPPTAVEMASVITTQGLLPAELSATVTLGSDPITSVLFEVLTDDFEFPEDAQADVQRTNADNANPTAELTTDKDGVYKVKLTVSDGTESLETIAVVQVRADACQAKKDSPGGWTANYFDLDNNCIVNLSDFAALAMEWLDDTSMTVQETFETGESYVPASVYGARTEAENVTDGDVSHPPVTGAPGVRIEDYPAASEGKALAFTSAGTWVEYDIDIPAGTYDLWVQTSTTNATAELHFGTEGEPGKYGQVSPFPANAWNTFEPTKYAGALTFDEAVTRLRITWVNAGVNLDWFAIVPQ